MRVAVLCILFLLPNLSFGQSTALSAYENAYLELEAMLKGTQPLSFKRAVFVTENAYFNDTLNYDLFNDKIRLFADLCQKISNQGGLIYNESDRQKVQLYAAAFRFMKDSVKFALSKDAYFETVPYTYDFDDFWGEKDWSKMFVTKLLESHSGNCHSLPFLYKILCEELGVPAWLSMAPNHTYIKLWCKKTGWYNTELTSGYFPIDAWIMASGYVHLSAVQNRIYMDTLSQKQSIAVSVIDLAKGYERKFGARSNSAFIKKCAELALNYYPNYVNALLLKAEVTKSEFEAVMNRVEAKYPKDALQLPEGARLFEQMENLYFQIHKLGYRKMPKEMYAEWLADLSKEKEKYSNKDLNLKQN